MNKTNSPRTDPVPWELDDKYQAYEFVKNHGWKVPKYNKCNSLKEAIQIGNSLGARFVIKQPGYHLGVGIWVLEKLTSDLYLDLLTFKVLNKDDIKPIGQSSEYFLVEELISSAYGSTRVPLDYKVYTFRGQISHILQIDRNVRPFRIAFFDNAFMPLSHRIYSIDRRRYRGQGHLLPIHGPEILTMCRDLSKSLDTEFVRIDCYDSNQGAMFGEFTFTSGAEAVGSIRYSSDMVIQLDRALEGVILSPFSGLKINLQDFYNACSLHKEPLVLVPRILGRKLEYAGIQSDIRYSQLFASFMTNSALSEHFKSSLKLIEKFNVGAY